MSTDPTELLKDIPPPKLDPSTFTHAVVVLTIIIAATVLRAYNHLDTATLSTIYGGGMGYATGLSVGRKNGGQ